MTCKWRLDAVCGAITHTLIHSTAEFAKKTLKIKEVGAEIEEPSQLSMLSG